MSKVMRRIVIFGAPLLVGIANWFHPVHFGATGVYAGIQPHVGWWITLHVINLFGFALLALAGYLLLGGATGKAARIGRIALAVFVPTYIGFDALIGIGTGTLVRYAQALHMPQLLVLQTAIDAFWSGNVATALAIAGSVAWGISMSASAVVFTVPQRRPGVAVMGVISGAFTGWGYSSAMFGTLPWWIGVGIITLITMAVARPSLPAAMLVLSGILFGTTHVVPYGPLGMAGFLVAAWLVEFGPQSVASENRLTRPAGARNKVRTFPGG